MLVDCVDPHCSVRLPAAAARFALPKIQEQKPSQKNNHFYTLAILVEHKSKYPIKLAMTKCRHTHISVISKYRLWWHVQRGERIQLWDFSGRGGRRNMCFVFASELWLCNLITAKYCTIRGLGNSFVQSLFCPILTHTGLVFPLFCATQICLAHIVQLQRIFLWVISSKVP
ncbi:hypothetical protein XELAEV_18039361mg [Xenopus laevis]|uniref:Uncharacterized protein n=1 Tax=Xenopus laevis TaxID=8355 RepID=A0A974C7P1_XENLA|nr:hypothetical protein XELAEV_18039361mg [Xenopus laevis]